MTDRKDLRESAFGVHTAAPDVESSTEVRRREEALGLLPVWTHVHEACGMLCRPRPAKREAYEEAAQVWTPAVQRTLRFFPHYLEVSLPLLGSSVPLESRTIGSASARNRLALWFLLQVLSSIGESPQFGDHGSCTLRADLAYVLREGMHYACFGDRRESFHPRTHAAALGRLVEYHAYSVVGLPSDYNIGRLLEEIGKQDGLNREIATDHLDHVLDLYIAGHFLLAVKICAPYAAEGAVLPAALHGQTIAEALTSCGATPDRDRAKRLTQAYTLASLFHDVGHLLFPRDSLPHDDLDWDDPEIAAELKKVENSVSQAGGDVAQKCVEDLAFAYYTEDELARWRDRLGADEPNHGLVGAWYLHRIGLNVLDRSGEVDGFNGIQTDILRMAVRAVLLHGTPTGQLRSDVDPVATMLIFCNEIFEWDPGRHLAPAPSSIGRSFHVMAADAPAREPRDAWIKIPSLSVRANLETGELESLLILGPADKTWPEIHVRLQPPQRLDVSVLRLWILKAQSLGRLVPTEHGFCPTLVIQSRADVALLARGLTTRTLLDRAVERKALAAIRPAMRAWLSLRDRFSETDGTDGIDESVHVGPLEGRMLFDNVMGWVKKIEEEAFQLVQSIDDESPEPRSGRL